ncbi:S8 family peptidase [Lentzea sp. NPDC004789]
MSLPTAVLSRHDAKMLDPTTAYQVGDFQPVGPTVYRKNELLIQMDNADHQQAAISQVLKDDLGLVMDPAPRAANGAPLIFRGVLRPDPHPVAARPTTVETDAWRALQKWRATVIESGNAQAIADLRQISLNYVMVGASMGGIGGVSAVLHGVPGAIGGNPNPGTDVDELGYWRRPVSIRLPRPERTVPRSGRRPVIAILDTGLGENEWLSVTRAENGAFATPTEACKFLTVDGLLQDAICTPAAEGTTPSYWEGAYTAEPLTGYLSSHTGHATFVIGVIHQTEPDADVLSIRVMYNDGIVYADVLVQALKKLHERIVDAQENGRPDQMVDVVCLSLGGYREAGLAGVEYDQLTKAIDDLRERGVIVVAAAGNYASSRPFFPAALADRPDDDFPPVISVGACNPNGTKAFFSNDGPWVRCWASGAAVISTFPENVNGSRTPQFRVTTNGGNELLAVRESLESDDYRYGCAEWSGTSFAAPMVAARIASLLIDEESLACAQQGAFGLDLRQEDFLKMILRREATLIRAKAAVNRL